MEKPKYGTWTQESVNSPLETKKSDQRKESYQWPSALTVVMSQLVHWIVSCGCGTLTLACSWRVSKGIPIQFIRSHFRQMAKCSHRDLSTGRSSFGISTHNKTDRLSHFEGTEIMFCRSSFRQMETGSSRGPKTDRSSFGTRDRTFCISCCRGTKTR